MIPTINMWMNKILANSDIQTYNMLYHGTCGVIKTRVIICSVKIIKPFWLSLFLYSRQLNHDEMRYTNKKGPIMAAEHTN